VKCDNYAYLGGVENFGEEISNFNVTESWEMSWERTVSGERTENLENVTKKVVGGAVKGEGWWGVVKITGEGHFDYTKEHKEGIAEKAGYSTSGTETRMIQYGTSIPVPPGQTRSV